MLKEGMFAKSGEGYRYGFNSYEKDDEIKGLGNSIDFGARIYDPRLGRFKSLDPLKRNFPSQTPYRHGNNNPIYLIDQDGKYPNPIKLILDLLRAFEPLTTNNMVGDLKKNGYFSRGYTIGQFGVSFQDAIIESIGEEENKEFYRTKKGNVRKPDLVLDTEVWDDGDEFYDNFLPFEKVVSFENATFGEIKFKPYIPIFEDGRYGYGTQLTDFIDIVSEQKGAYIDGEYHPELKASDYGLAFFVLLVPMNCKIDPELVAYATSKNVKMNVRYIERDKDQWNRIRVAPGELFLNHDGINLNLTQWTGGELTVDKPSIPGHSVEITKGIQETE